MAEPKILYVLRHGEARPGIGIKGDFLRELTVDGRQQLKRLAEYLKSIDFKTDLILVSPAKRTQQSLEILTTTLAIKNNQITHDEIFDAEPQTLLDIINNINQPSNNILLVGHNPGISSLVSFVSGQNYISMKPGMMAVLEILVDDWRSLGANTGVLKEILQ
ncbi:SixA phosphatase family protein [Aquiflexum lacus]|uniref:SixA phosphatase family protein n=1 Tax=Aquiflexum lacus TaxID=2483805 RepID=UPI001893444C|nr:histidine phosphatase family protein [Aquiflexum lacus]